MAVFSLALVMVGGCACRPDPGPRTPPIPVERGSPPPYAQVAAIYNARAEPLARLWIPTTCRIWFYEEDGRERQEQLDGLLMYDRPSRFHLRLDKVSHPVAVLGSNEDQYWWFELGDDRRGWIGSHEAVTPERIAELGLPVHPLDLVELLGIVPLPNGAGSPSRLGESASPPVPPMWSPDGRWLIVTTPARIGWRRLWLDPDADLEPGRIELVSADGQTSLLSQLSEFDDVNLPGRARGRSAREAVIFLDARGTRARMRMNFQERPGRINPAAFDLDLLRRTYRIGDDAVTWLDDEPIAADQPDRADPADRLSSRP